MFHVGIGDRFNESKGQVIKPGGYMQVPKGVQHFAWASEDTVVQVHSVGPVDRFGGRGTYSEERPRNLSTER
jgi:hypothetical protein